MLVRIAPGIVVLGLLLAAGLYLGLAGDADRRADANSSAALPVEPTATWVPFCELGPPPEGWDSWEPLATHAAEVISTFGPPPTPEPVPFDEAEFDGPSPPGYETWEEFVDESVTRLREVEASGAQAEAACTGEQVCREFSFGPLCVAPPGMPVTFCVGPGCPTAEPD